PTAPIMPGTQRVTMLFPRTGRTLDVHKIATTPEGLEVYIARGGINLVTQGEKFGIIDIEADEAVIWRSPETTTGPNGEWSQDERQPMEVYLEGNVIVRQDQAKWAGRSDQRTLRAPRLYYDFLNDRFVAHDA